MDSDARIPRALLVLRLTIFLVMLVWTFDKLIQPEHAASVYEHFYFIGGLGSGAMAAIAALELVLLAGFVVGFAKKWTYGAVLVFHAVSTFSSWQQYLDPFENLLFFAAWPMLGACWALFSLRDLDTLGTIGKD